MTSAAAAAYYPTPGEYTDDMTYLQQTGLRSLLTEFVSDVTADQPGNVYAYLADWAHARGAEERSKAAAADREDAFAEL